MKKKSWNYVKEGLGNIVRRIFLIIFGLSVLLCITYCLELRFGGHISSEENIVYDIAFYTAIFSGIVMFNDFSRTSRLAAIIICGILGVFDFLIRL